MYSNLANERARKKIITVKKGNKSKIPPLTKNSYSNMSTPTCP